MSQQEILQPKHKLRSKMKEAFNTLSKDIVDTANTRITESCLLLAEINNANTICIYLSLPDEVGTYSLFTELRKKNKRVVVPKIYQSNLQLYEAESLKHLINGSFGILEPSDTLPRVKAEDVECFIVPGIAFDTKGHRLGRGMGYYDRLLEHISQPKIALALDAQIVPMVPNESYDIVMDVIITETKIITIKH